jgi:hypothetical protein
VADERADESGDEDGVAEDLRLQTSELRGLGRLRPGTPEITRVSLSLARKAALF